MDCNHTKNITPHDADTEMAKEKLEKTIAFKTTDHIQAAYSVLSDKKKARLKKIIEDFVMKNDPQKRSKYGLE